MTMAWVKRVSNNSSAQITLRQEDPTYHPVINASSGVSLPEQHLTNPEGVQVQSGQSIVISPGGWIECDWFVIPWRGSGKLELIGPPPHRSQSVVLGDANSFDYLIFDGTVNEQLKIAGKNSWSNAEFTIEIDDDKGVVFKPPSISDFDWLRKQLIELGMNLLKALVSA